MDCLDPVAEEQRRRKTTLVVNDLDQKLTPACSVIVNKMNVQYLTPVWPQDLDENRPRQFSWKAPALPNV